MSESMRGLKYSQNDVLGKGGVGCHSDEFSATLSPSSSSGSVPVPDMRRLFGFIPNNTPTTSPEATSMAQ